MAIKENNSVVGIEYELTEAGKSEILDTNKGSIPLEFITGKGHIIPGLERQLVGMKEGESASILVKAEEAYGLRDKNAVQTLPREKALWRDWSFEERIFWHLYWDQGSQELGKVTWFPRVKKVGWTFTLGSQRVNQFGLTSNPI